MTMPTLELAGRRLVYFIIYANVLSGITNLLIKHAQRWQRRGSGRNSTPPFLWRWMKQWVSPNRGSKTHDAYNPQVTTRAGRRRIFRPPKIIVSLVCVAGHSAERLCDLLFLADCMPMQTKKGLRWVLYDHMTCFLFSLIEVVVSLAAKAYFYTYGAVAFLLHTELMTFSSSCSKRHYIARQEGSTEVERYRIVFIRHGESVWNRAFNRGLRVHGICGALKIFLWELCLLGDIDSMILDSPLSKEGAAQAARLHDWVARADDAGDELILASTGGGMGVKGAEGVLQSKKEEKRDARLENDSSAQRARAFVQELRQLHEAGNLVFITSNLRRAISTIAIGFQSFFAMSGQKILVHSAFQEVTRNPDSICLAPRGSGSYPSIFETEYFPPNVDIGSVYEDHVEWQNNDGNKSITSRLESRIEKATSIIVAEISQGGKSQSATKPRVAVVCGHSLWFRKFFEYYLPHSWQGGKCAVSRRKISNCGIVQFDLMKRVLKDGTSFLIVDPSSIDIIRGRLL